jgi:hypothetical protein
MTVRVTEGLIEGIKQAINSIYISEMRNTTQRVGNLMATDRDAIVDSLLNGDGRYIRANYGYALVSVSSISFRPVVPPGTDRVTTHQQFASNPSHILTMTMDVTMSCKVDLPLNCMVDGVVGYTIEEDRQLHWNLRRANKPIPRIPHTLVAAIEPSILPTSVRDAFTSAMDVYAELQRNKFNALGWLSQNAVRGAAVSSLLAKYPMLMHAFPDEFRDKWEKNKPSRTRAVDDHPHGLADLTSRLAFRALNRNSNS